MAAGIVRRKTSSVVKALGDWFEPFKVPEDPDKPFIERYRAHVQTIKARRKTPEFEIESAKFTTKVLKFLMAFQAPSMIYVYMAYIVPHTFEGYNPWTIFIMKLLCWAVLFNGLSNYLLTMLTDTTAPRIENNPEMPPKIQLITPQPPEILLRPNNGEVTQEQTNGHSVYNIESKEEEEAFSWKFCEKCNVYMPPRSHHCKYCDKCILKRDHHCNMVGNCIGFHNQRFFLVLTFYAMITGLLGAFFTMKYIYEALWPTMYSWTDLVLPITLVRYLFGNLPGLQALLILHCYLEIPFGVFGVMHCTTQFMYATIGLTPYEVQKELPLKNSNSPGQNMRSVFGPYWALNYVFPMRLFYKQTDNGMHWGNIKIDHSVKGKSKDKGKAPSEGQT